ncbi:hypothetical protein F2Q68_00013467 [Brassica cretica]|uniref:ADP,ATP carrier protein n=1 Tax=Brassica cretica TaxID=69181 RepID=A0A8S9HXM9_BRACR|nr:hypothetical protein F2Q68_00013467 [Brassica cretica]
MKVSDVSDSVNRNDDAAIASDSEKPVSQIGVSSGGDGSMKSTGRAVVSKSPIKSVSKTDISSGVVNLVRSRGATAESQSLIQTHGKTGASSGPIIGVRGRLSVSPVDKGKSIVSDDVGRVITFKDVTFGPHQDETKESVIHGFIPYGRIDTYLPHMKAGCTYRLNKFFGSKSKTVYRVADSDVTISFSWNSALTALEDSSIHFPDDRIRIHGFREFDGASDMKGDLYGKITTVDEAKKFYPLFGLGANVALIFSGRTVKYFSNMRKNLGPGVDGWAVSLKAMMSIVVGMGLAICFLYWWVNRYVPLPTRSKKKKAKPPMGTMESLKFLVSSPYIRDLATLVVAYGISINLVEVTWKSKLKAQFPSPNEYSAFMGDFSTCTGIATFTMMLLSQYVFDKYGWGVAAKITPTVLLVTGVAFFSLILFGGPFAPLVAKLGMTPLLAAVYVGALQNIFSKSAKYSLFDPCKEMAYIPLDEDTKVKGKAAIDVVCNPLGKSGGALIQQFMILTFGSLASSTPYLGVILLGIVTAWLAAAKSLEGQFNTLMSEEELEKEMERASSLKIPVVSQEDASPGESTSQLPEKSAPTSI